MSINELPHVSFGKKQIALLPTLKKLNVNNRG